MNVLEAETKGVDSGNVIKNNEIGQDPGCRKERKGGIKYNPPTANLNDGGLAELSAVLEKGRTYCTCSDGFNAPSSTHHQSMQNFN